VSEDWLETSESAAALPASVELPADYMSRAALMTAAWERLSTNQKTFLAAYRENRFNERATCRSLGLSDTTKPNTGWMRNPDYALVVRVWRANVAAEAQDRDRLLARHDGIVEELLTPVQQISRDGLVLGEKADLNGAARANETLMKAAGLLKDKEVEINVGISVGPPTLNIQVMPAPPSKAIVAQTVAIDAQYTEVPSDDSWIEE
jgi:hypothetical protein